MAGRFAQGIFSELTAIVSTPITSLSTPFANLAPFPRVRKSISPKYLTQHPINPWWLQRYTDADILWPVQLACKRPTSPMPEVKLKVGHRRTDIATKSSTWMQTTKWLIDNYFAKTFQFPLSLMLTSARERECCSLHGPFIFCNFWAQVQILEYGALQKYHFNRWAKGWYKPGWRYFLAWAKITFIQPKDNSSLTLDNS